MPLVRVPVPFDHPEWVFEIKYDGFRTLAYIQDRTYQLISRNGAVFASFPDLTDWLAHHLNVQNAIIDGEICCLDSEGRTIFHPLLERKCPAYLYAFDLLWLNRKDLTGEPLLKRKRSLRGIIPSGNSFLLYAEYARRRGRSLFRAAIDRGLEGIVGKWKDGKYLTDGTHTNWVKIKAPTYSQAIGRQELFEGFRGRRQFGAKARLQLPRTVRPAEL